MDRAFKCCCESSLSSLRAERAADRRLVSGERDVCPVERIDEYISLAPWNSWMWENDTMASLLLIQASEIDSNETKLVHHKRYIGYCALRPNHHLTYFYFSFSDTRRQNAESFLRAVLRQLLLQQSSIPDAVRDLYKSFKHSNSPTHIWVGALKALIDRSAKYYIIIDAVDECPAFQHQRASLLQIFESIKSVGSSKLNLLMTSRKEADIEEVMVSRLNFDAVNIQNTDVDYDITLHIKSQLEADPTMQRWPSDVRQTVERELSSKAGGMYVSSGLR